MLTRFYRIVEIEVHQRLVVKFKDESLELLSEFLTFEVNSFAPIILKGLENVLFNSQNDYSFSGNLLDFECDKQNVTIYHLYDEERAPSRLSTQLFYQLAGEYVYVKTNMGTDNFTFPLTVEDGVWL